MTNNRIVNRYLNQVSANKQRPAVHNPINFGRSYKIRREIDNKERVTKISAYKKEQIIDIGVDV